MDKRIRVIQYGIGPIALKTTGYLAGRSGFEIVAAIDKDKGKIGKDLGNLAGFPRPLGILLRDDALKVLMETDAEVVVLTTSSSLEETGPQVLEIVAAGKHVVSTCEELVYPWLTGPKIAARIDKAAKAKGVAVLSTGVNPGFLMDFLPLALTGVCRSVSNIRVDRIQDARFRRLPFQKKIGAGLTPEEFAERVKEGVLRHVGLVESIHLLSSSLGWRLDKTEESIEPVIASEAMVAGDLTITAGRALGVQQIAKGFAGSGEVITLVFRATIGEPDPHDRIFVEGTPQIDLKILQGVNGDIATCSIVVNAIPAVIKARPGLRTMADVGLIPCAGWT
jgi:2,4-diaminopentanoate dehydrogenase